MQAMIIGLLVFNMVGRFNHVDSYSLYVCAIVIRVTELVLPVWFCCSLWNYKKLVSPCSNCILHALCYNAVMSMYTCPFTFYRPTTLWILNPRLVLKLDRNVRTLLVVLNSFMTLSSQEKDTESSPILREETSNSYGAIQRGKDFSNVYMYCCRAKLILYEN